MSTQPLARSALVIGLGNMGSRVLGLARELVIASLFGATATTDAFRVAFRVPLALYDLLVGGMISAALVPVFSSYATDGQRRELGERARALITLLLLALSGVAALLVIAAPSLMRLLAAGYPDEVRALSVDLVRLLVPTLILMGLSGVLTAVLYAQDRFHLPALAAMAYNAGMVTAALALHRYFSIASLALGALAGAGLQLALQSPGLRGLGFRLRLDLRDPGVRQVLRLYLPVALGLLVSTVGIAIDTNLASRTGAGNLAAMGFATSLVQFPLGLIAAGVSSAVLPTLSRHAQRMADAAAATSAPETQGLFGASAALPERVSGGPLMPGAPPPGIGATLQDVPQAAYKEALALGLKLVFTAIVPATLGLLVLRGPIVRVLFQRGAFGTAAAQRTTTAFLAYSPGLPAAALDQLLIFGFYARKQTLPPVLVGIMGVGVYLTVGLALLGPLGMPGLALANSAQWVVHMLVMGVLTHRALGGLGGLGLPGTALRVLAATGAMTALLLLATILAPPQILEGAGALGAYLTILMAGGALAYLAVLRLVGPEELRLLTSAVRRRVGSDE